MTTLMGSSRPFEAKHEGFASAARAIMTDETPARASSGEHETLKGKGNKRTSLLAQLLEVSPLRLLPPS